MRRTLMTLVAAGTVAAATAGCGVGVTTTKTVVVTRTRTAPAIIVTQTATSTHTIQTRPTAGTGRNFSGSSEENIGTIHVARESTLVWRCEACSQGNFIIDNDFSDANTIDVNALDQATGRTVIEPGTYTQVEVQADGPWTFTIVPGNTTQQ